MVTGVDVFSIGASWPPLSDFPELTDFFPPQTDHQSPPDQSAIPLLRIEIIKNIKLNGGVTWKKLKSKAGN